jgi:hypothetical protein
VGVENLRGASEFDRSNPQDEAHAWTFVRIAAAENVWVRDVTTQYFGFALVEIGRSGKWVTVQDCTYLDPVSRIQGSRRYPYSINGQLSLVQRCYARDGRHDYSTGSIVTGPNVFLDSVGEASHADSGPHHRWAVGILYDNISISGHRLIVQDRLNLGSGHGWAGANQVFWNSKADAIVCQMPPTAQNWAIGCVGAVHPGIFPREPGHIDSHGKPVAPRSLYLQQLQDRLGVAGVHNIATAKQIKGD